MRAIPSKEHFHIHWSGQENIDWERFDSYADAESAAQELVRHYETYAIETFDNDTCERCQSVQSARSAYAEKRYSAAD